MHPDIIYNNHTSYKLKNGWILNFQDFFLTNLKIRKPGTWLVASFKTQLPLKENVDLMGWPNSPTPSRLRSKFSKEMSRWPVGFFLPKVEVRHRRDIAYLHPGKIHIPQLTAKTPEYRPFAPKENVIWTNHPFFRCYVVSFREGNMHFEPQSHGGGWKMMYDVSFSIGWCLGKPAVNFQGYKFLQGYQEGCFISRKAGWVHSCRIRVCETNHQTSYECACLCLMNTVFIYLNITQDLTAYCK